MRPSSVAPDPAESRLRGSGAGTLGVPLEGTRRVGGLLRFIEKQMASLSSPGLSNPCLRAADRCLSACLRCLHLGALCHDEAGCE